MYDHSLSVEDLLVYIITIFVHVTMSFVRFKSHELQHKKPEAPRDHSNALYVPTVPLLYIPVRSFFYVYMKSERRYSTEATGTCSRTTRQSALAVFAALPTKKASAQHTPVPEHDGNNVRLRRCRNGCSRQF